MLEMIESKVIGIFSDYLENRELPYAEQFKIGENRCDIVYLEGGDVKAIEAKGDISKEGIYQGFSQAILYQKGADFVYLLLPSTVLKEVDDYLADQTGVGVFVVSEDSTVREAITAEKKKPDPNIKTSIKEEIEKVKEQKHKKAKLKTSHGQTRGRILKLLKKYKTLTPKEIARELGINFGSVHPHLRTLLARGKITKIGKKEIKGASPAVWPVVYAPSDEDPLKLKDETSFKIIPLRGSLDMIPELLDEPKRTREIRQQLEEKGHNIEQSAVFTSLRKLENEGKVTHFYTSKGRDSLWVRSEDADRYEDLKRRDIRSEIVESLRKESPKDLSEIRVALPHWSKSHLQSTIRKLVEKDEIYVCGEKENKRLYAHPMHRSKLRDNYLSIVQEKLLMFLKDGPQTPFDLTKKVGDEYTYNTVRSNLTDLESKGFIEVSGKRGQYSIYNLLSLGESYLETARAKAKE